MGAWRRPRGIDSRFRRQFRGCGKMPKIGYKQDVETRFKQKNGLFTYTLRNPKDLDMLMMHNKVYCCVIAKTISAKTRKEVIKRADQLNIRIMNRQARVSTEECE